MKKAIFISSLFAIASLTLTGQSAFSQSENKVRVSDQSNSAQTTSVRVSDLPNPPPTTAVKVSDEPTLKSDEAKVKVSDQPAATIQEVVRVTGGSASVRRLNFQEFRFSIPFAPDVQSITPEAPPPQTVINLITPPTPVCPLPVVQPEENPAAVPVAITGTVNNSGFSYNLTWSCTGYAGGCLISKNGQDYFKVDGDGILNNLPIDHFPNGTPASQTKVTIQIKSGSATDQWVFNGIIDAPAGPVIVPQPVIIINENTNSGAPVKGNAYATLVNSGNTWLANQDSLSGGPLISSKLPSYEVGNTIGASSFLSSAQNNFFLPPDSVAYPDMSQNDGQVRLRSGFQVQPGEYLWKEFKKYKVQYSYGAGWGVMANNPGAGNLGSSVTITPQAFNYAYNAFRSRAYQANCAQNPDSEWFDVGNGSVQFFNNPNTPDKTIPLQTLYGPFGTPEAYAESQPFATHNKDEAPGSTVMLDLSLKITSFLSSPSARDRLAVTDSYNPGGTPLWKQKIADALCVRVVEEGGESASVQYRTLPAIWKDAGTFYVNPNAPPPAPVIPPTISIIGIKPGDLIPANSSTYATLQQHPGEAHTLINADAQSFNFTVNNLAGPASNYTVYGKIFGHPDTTPPPPHHSADIVATLISPAPYQVLTAGTQNKIYWSGGAGTMSLVLMKGQVTNDTTSDPEGINAYYPTQAVGYIARNLSPNSEIFWDGKTVCDTNGANCQPVASLGNGPFFMYIYQNNIQDDPSVTLGAYSRYRPGSPNYRGYYTLGQWQLASGPYFIEQTQDSLPRFTDIAHGGAGISFTGSNTGEGDFARVPGYFKWSPQPGDYGIELGLVENSTKKILAKTSVTGFDAGIPVITVTSPKPGDTVDINKPFAVTWTANKYVQPDADVSFTLNNYPDTDYVKGDEMNRRYINNPPTPYTGNCGSVCVSNSGIEPEQGWAQFSLKGIGKAKDGSAVVDLRSSNIGGGAFNTAIARILTPGWQGIEQIPANKGLQVHSANVGLKDYIKLGGTMDLVYLTLTASNGGIYQDTYAALPSGLLDYSQHLASGFYRSNSLDWTTAPFRITGPVIEVPPPATPGSALMRVTYDPYNGGGASTNQTSSGVDSSGVYFHNYVYGAKVPYNQPYNGNAGYNQPFTIQWAFPQKGHCDTIGDTDLYSYLGSTVWNNTDKSQMDMSSNAGIDPQGVATILSNPKGGYRQKLNIGIQCTDGVTTEKAMLEVPISPPANGVAADPVLLNTTGMPAPTITLNGVQGFSSPAGFVIPADNSQAPNDVPEGNQMTVSWSAPSILTSPILQTKCDMFGAPLALTDGRNWNQLTEMPVSGTVMLVAKDDQLPVVTYFGRKVRMFNLGVQCHSSGQYYGGASLSTKSAGLNMKITAPAGSVSTSTIGTAAAPFVPSTDPVDFSVSWADTKTPIWGGGPLWSGILSKEIRCITNYPNQRCYETLSLPKMTDFEVAWDIPGVTNCTAFGDKVLRKDGFVWTADGSGMVPSYPSKGREMLKVLDTADTQSSRSMLGLKCGTAYQASNITRILYFGNDQGDNLIVRQINQASPGRLSTSIFADKTWYVPAYSKNPFTDASLKLTAVQSVPTGGSLAGYFSNGTNNPPATKGIYGQNTFALTWSAPQSWGSSGSYCDFYSDAAALDSNKTPFNGSAAALHRPSSGTMTLYAPQNDNIASAKDFMVGMRCYSGYIPSIGSKADAFNSLSYMMWADGLQYKTPNSASTAPGQYWVVPLSTDSSFRGSQPEDANAVVLLKSVPFVTATTVDFKVATIGGAVTSLTTTEGQCPTASPQGQTQRCYTFNGTIPANESFKVVWDIPGMAGCSTNQNPVLRADGGNWSASGASMGTWYGTPGSESLIAQDTSGATSVSLGLQCGAAYRGTEVNRLLKINFTSGSASVPAPTNPLGVTLTLGYIGIQPPIINPVGYSTNGVGVPPLVSSFGWPLPHPANYAEGGQPFGISWNSPGASYCDFNADGPTTNQYYTLFNGSSSALNQPASGTNKVLFAPLAALNSTSPRLFSVGIRCYASNGASTKPEDPNSMIIMRIPAQPSLQIRTGSVLGTIGALVSGIGSWLVGIFHLRFK